MTKTELQKVKRAAAKAALAVAARDEAIRAAHTSGDALRTIAEAAGVSHEQVRRILQRDG